MSEAKLWPRLALLIGGIISAPLASRFYGHEQGLVLDDVALKAELQRLWATCGEWETCFDCDYDEMEKGHPLASNADEPPERRAPEATFPENASPP